jgi:divalent metal cation (Fe/Co/Zn/Cd) transporter
VTGGPAADNAAGLFHSAVEARHTLLRRALQLSVLSIVLSGVVGSIAVLTALASGSLSLLGFGFDAAIDSAASIVLVWRFRIERQHPHRAERVERLAEIAVGVVFIVLAVYLGVSAVRALAGNEHPEPTLTGLALLLVSLVALPPLAMAKYRVATLLRSGALRADSMLTALAAVLALISLLGLSLAEGFGLTWADAVGALIVTVVLAREGWSSLRAKPLD